MEKKLAKSVGGRRRYGSGNLWWMKGDVVSDDFLIEHKFSDGKQFALKESTLKKIFEEAIKEGKTPMFVIEFKKYGLRGEVYYANSNI